MWLGQSDVSASPSTPDRGDLQEMSLDVGVAGPPGLEVQVDLQAGLVLSRVRDFDDDDFVPVRVGLAVRTPQVVE